tara:strand:+ start:885 stop:1100 length:216 start_codon:yes stop_codon:yes gene_type:complete
MEKDLLIKIDEKRINLDFLLDLKEIFKKYPGETNVIMKIVQSEDLNYKLLELKSLKVFVSIDLMIEIMEII